MSQTLAFLTRIFFRIHDADALTKSIEDKNWKMSELVDQALASTNIKEFIEIIQAKAPEFYKVQRVNIYMCDHRREEIYQIVSGGDKPDVLVFYSNQSGIAGKVSNVGKSFIANNVQDYHQFVPEIDDPGETYHPVTGLSKNGTVNILTVPIF
mmetsp:Transcript_2401/g.2265  ORF Transcript_2401/g.2265 Transcript_2401/m.2265 type:complete len:153 (+) Transcript_2401:619-1077(+)